MNRIVPILLVVTLGCSNTTDKSSFGDRSRSIVPEYSTTTFRSVISDLISENRYVDAVSYLENADAGLQADHDKTGFLAVGEDLVVLPGIHPDCDYDRDRDWVFPGTSDAIENDSWQNAATAFAAKYNEQRTGKQQIVAPKR